MLEYKSWDIDKNEHYESNIRSKEAFGWRATSAYDYKTHKKVTFSRDTAMPNYAKLVDVEKSFYDFFDAAVEAFSEEDVVRHKYSNVANVILIVIATVGLAVTNGANSSIQMFIPIASMVCGIIGAVRLIIRVTKMSRIKKMKKICEKGMIDTMKYGWLLQNPPNGSNRTKQ